MTTVFLSPVAPAAGQFFDNNGNPLTGGKIYTYVAGTTTPLATYTTSAGVTTHSNPIILDAAGRVSGGGEIWFNTAQAYKFVVTDSNDVLIGSYDNLVTASSAFIQFTGFNGQTGPISDLASGTGADLIGYTYTNGTARSVQNRLKDYVSVKDFGAVADGVANDRSAFVQADATGRAVYVPAGNYLIGSTITLSAEYTFDKGAVLVIGNGVTVNFTGAVNAAPYRIFNCTGTGAVTFDPSKTSVGYAEWWGALVNDSGAQTQTTTAINAALVALRKTQLLAGIYWTNGRLYMGTGYRELAGVGQHYDGASALQATRILCMSATEVIMQVGPDVYPGSVNALPESCVVRDLLLDRGIAPSVPAVATGMRVQYVLRAEITRTRVEQCIYGYHCIGTVYTKFTDCDSFRSLAGSGGTDLYYGFFIDGQTNIGLAGGNGSLYFNRCAASVGGIAIADSSGFYANAAFTDLFIFECETSACAVGINIQGNASNSVVNPTNTDLQIVSPVVDTFTYAGIYFNNVNSFGSCEVIGGYYGAAAGAIAALYIDNSYGVTAIGGQIPLYAGTTTHGVSIDNSTGCRVEGMNILEATAAAVTLGDAYACTVRPSVKNYSATCAAAVQLFPPVAACTIEPQVSGASGKVSLGIQVVGTGDVRNEYRCTGIDSTAISGGSANKLTRNGVQITSTGLSGSNLVSGVMT